MSLFSPNPPAEAKQTGCCTCAITFTATERGRGLSCTETFGNAGRMLRTHRTELGPRALDMFSSAGKGHFRESQASPTCFRMSDCGTAERSVSRQLRTAPGARCSPWAGQGRQQTPQRTPRSSNSRCAEVFCPVKCFPSVTTASSHSSETVLNCEICVILFLPE